MSKENETGGTSWYFGKSTAAGSEPVWPTTPTTSASIQFSCELPLSQSSDQSIHCSDTILTHQPSHSPSAFSQPQPQPHPQSHSQSTHDRNASSSSSNTQSNIRSSLSNLHPSSSISAQNSVPSTYSSSYQIFR